MTKSSYYIAENIKYWNELADIHFDSPFYDVEGVLKGNDTLSSIDTEILGNVNRRSLLHLQCHFGLDTISWARRGAIATGVDISPRAIELAHQLANKTGISVDFLCCDVSQLSKFLKVKFDIVWAVEGIFAWIPNLKHWMKEVANSLLPEGILYLRDFHPIAEVFANEELSPRICRSYFSSIRCVKSSDESGTYAELHTNLRQPIHYEWQYSISDIVNALLQSGFIILQFQEYPFCSYRSHKFLVKEAEGRWVFPIGCGSIPLMFSILACRNISVVNNIEELNEKS